ncbi:MAG: DNA-binding protein [Clostridium sp.]|uniref:DNA-binding protein n=1 Tax=Clostridium sp. TaxID=1506 RepID=UPI001898FC07|nr:DNA-binding protein [Clostridium sp.]MDB2123845.1 DNA-binding protein [Clostridium paraputrificum]MDU6875394.1 DNA-binding protein [Clostridium sp.]
MDLNQIHDETGILVVTLQSDIRKQRLKAKKIGRKYMVTREDLNRYLGIENVDEILKRDLEIAKLKNQLEGFRRQYTTLKQLMDTMQGIINIL